MDPKSLCGNSGFVIAGLEVSPGLEELSLGPGVFVGVGFCAIGFEMAGFGVIPIFEGVGFFPVGFETSEFVTSPIYHPNAGFIARVSLSNV